MTEEKQKEEAPKEIPKVEETLRRIIREEIKQALPQPQNTAQTSKNISDTSESQAEHNHEEKKGHATVEEIDNCPTCRTPFKVDEFKTKHLEEHWKEKLPRDQLAYVCANEKCGEGVLVEEKSCPKCGGTKAHKRV